MKVAVTGASGLLGRAILRVLKSDSAFEVLGLGFLRAKDGLERVDLTKEDEVKNFVVTKKPDVIIHCAAQRRPDIVEMKPEATEQLNVQATQIICKAAAENGAYVLYMSTDYVFDGKNPPYEADSQPNPLNKYGISKLAGEEKVLQVDQKNVILRVPILYGDVESLEESAVTILFQNLLDKSKTHVMSHYEIRYPTYTNDIAEVISGLLKKKEANPSLSGIFHYSGSQSMTKYEMCVAMAEVFDLPHDHIKSDSTPSTGASRPFNAHLASTRIEQLGIYKATSFKDAIKPCLAPYFKGKS